MIRYVLVAILLLLLARAFWKLVDSIIEAAGGRPSGTARRAAATKLFRDPVCGTFVTPRQTLSLQAGSTTHYFCSEACREAFRKGR